MTVSTSNTTDVSNLQAWLPLPPADWRQQLANAAETYDVAALQRLARFRLDFLAVSRLDRVLTKALAAGSPHALQTMRLAVLASSTTHHLVAALRISALRRGILLEVHEGGYGQYMQELAAEHSPLKSFAPQVILFALDAHHVADLAASGVGPIDRLRDAWRMARSNFDATILQQSVLEVFPALLGSNEHRLPSSPRSVVRRVNDELRRVANEDGVHVIALDEAAAWDGLSAWHDAAMWFRAKQEVHPAAAPLYGELVAPMLASVAGRAAKCLVLDLDNTLWGGVIGDDGMEGIALGQGHAAGEAFVEFQQYCLRLRERGVLLALCSKNTESVAMAAIAGHSAMVLRREHFAAVRVNWQDKATNLREIAHALNIGLDALVFADDNPFERELVRRELPEAAVPEMPDDPAGFAATIARGGYFESLGLTAEDAERAAQYQANAQREEMRACATDLESYLRSLKMELRYRAFDEANLPRIAQLVGKTNQFNLTTRRYSLEELRAIMRDPSAVTLQLSLRDAFGDNGTIGAVIAYARGEELFVDTWLMSCRVLGRKVEEATLQLLVEAARTLGLKRIVGEIIPTSKNMIVRELYSQLGFERIASPRANDQTEGSQFALDIAGHIAPELPFSRISD